MAIHMQAHSIIWKRFYVVKSCMFIRNFAECNLAKFRGHVCGKTNPLDNHLCYKRMSVFYQIIFCW